MTRLHLTAKNQFKRDAKKRFSVMFSENWTEVAYRLMNGLPLSEKYNDHALSGNWNGFRECHIQPDLLLIYSVEDDYVQLVRLGSHAELFG